ncbi:MAG: HAMP domain-containing histidine kinase [Gemmataceae bacterium]|nr:HAMP domain-containing histidine kinase [Gemmataceae bacterium]
MPSARFERITATIRFRLMLFMIAVVVVLVIAAMVGVRQIYRTSLLREFDQGLKADIKRVGKEIHKNFPHWKRLEESLQDIALAHSLVKWFAEVYDEHGNRIATGGYRPTDLPPLSGPADGKPRDELPYRLVVATFEEPGLATYTMRIGAHRRSYEETVGLLDETMFVRSLVIVLLAPVGGYLIALRATRPIAHIIATAARLQPSRLDERLPIRGTGDELDRLSQTINGLLDRIAVYINRSREFVAHAAHELRSPLAALRGSVELALNHQRSPEEYASLLSDIIVECQYLSNLVNRLLILAEGDAGLPSVRGQTTRLDRIIRESLDMFEAVAEMQGIALQASPLPAAMVPGDEFYLRQVVRNLVDNAVKFSPPGSTVRVDLRIDGQRRHAVFSIADQGPGIPEADIPHVFERFYRGNKARSHEPNRRSSGLGLSICHTIVEALGGTIAFDSELGRGTTFTVSLPLADADQAAISDARTDLAAVPTPAVG